MPDPCNPKEHFQSFIRKKYETSKAIKSNNLSVKNFSKPKYCWYNID